jgi:hypothetical protein
MVIDSEYGLRLCKQLLDEHCEMDRKTFLKKIERGFPEIRLFSRVINKQKIYRSFGAVFDLVSLVSRDVQDDNVQKMLRNSRVTNAKILHFSICTTIWFELAQVSMHRNFHHDFLMRKFSVEPSVFIHGATKKFKSLSLYL